VKWGPEVHSENIAVRVAWAAGYFAEVTYFVRAGTIDGARELQRARECINNAGAFADARFELDDPAVKKMFEEHSWAWNDNPFLRTAQLNGLKIIEMLLSNWDTKDRRDVARGSNTAIFEYRVAPWRREARYLITDWGGSMGRWGGNIVTRGRWDPEFKAQTEFVARVGETSCTRLRWSADGGRGGNITCRRALAARVSRTDHRRPASRRSRQRRPTASGRFTRALRIGSRSLTSGRRCNDQPQTANCQI
jgi:hypothetical protein